MASTDSKTAWTSKEHNDLAATVASNSTSISALQNGGSLPYNVKDYGAVGNGVADDTAAIQAAFDAAKVAKVPVFFPKGTFNLTSEVTISRRGQRILGASSWYTVISQLTAAAHAFTINDDTDDDVGQGNTSNNFIIVEGLRILGLGVGTSTGYGINAPSDGDWMAIRDVVVRGFTRGVSVNGWAQVDFDNCVLTFNDINLYCDQTDSATNTINLRNTGIAHATTIGADIQGGGGCSINGGDWDNQPLALRVGNDVAAAQVTMIGGNFEVVTGSGTEFIQVNTNSRLTLIGPTGTQGAGNNVDLVKIKSGVVFVINPNFTPGAGKAVVNKTADTDIVEVVGTVPNLSTSQAAVRGPGTTINYARFPQRADNGIPTASATNRGLLLQVAARDASTDVDRLVFYARDRAASADNYSAHLLTGVVNSSTVDITLTDINDVMTVSSSVAVRTATLPTSAGRRGKRFTIKKTDSSVNAVAVATTSSQTIDGAATYSLAAQWNSVTVVSDGSNWLIVAKV